jgi:uncharacterized protein (TIGR00269 family)
MRCDKCKRDAIIFQKYSGLHLCNQHFIQDLESKAKRAIRTHQWMKRGDHIAVAISGHVSSAALLFFLKKLTEKRRDITILAITIDEGIPGYSNPTEANQIASSLGITCIRTDFNNAYGITMDEIVQMKGNANSYSYCKILRQSLLHRTAQKHGITKIALGVNLDDEAQLVLTSILNGYPETMAYSNQIVNCVVPFIRPFMYIPEHEVILYARLNIKHNFESGHFPYITNTKQEYVKKVLNEFNFRHPSTSYSLLNLGERLSRICKAMKDQINTCKKCGEPCGETCLYCRILEEVNDNAT